MHALDLMLRSEPDETACPEPGDPAPGDPSAEEEARRLAEIDRRVGESVRLSRTLRGMTADDLARRVGVTMQQVAKYESGVNRISAGMLYLIARELRVPVSTLFGTDSDSDHGLRTLLVRRGAAPSDSIQREAVQLAVAFSRIKDRGMRREVLSMLRLIAEMNAAPPARAPGGKDRDRAAAPA